MTTLYGYVSNKGEPLYDDILNSDLPQEEKVKQIQMRGQEYRDEADRQKLKDYGRIGLGGLVSAASFHPILNIPYVGTGIGGAMYDTGMGIMEGDILPELAKRAGRGFVIGETVGAIPYVGKAASKTKAGQAVLNSAPVKAVGDALNKAGEKIAQSKAYDTLMTDVRAFNPNKQTVYHGSPYDFSKFSNEAIGTGEGAQAHGLGHYAALNKDVAEGYRKQLSRSTKEERLIKQYGKERVLDDLQKELNTNLQELQTLQKSKIEQAKIKDFGRRKPINYDNSIKIVEDEIKNIENQIYNINNPQISGQLYKLSVPKDDVMLREGARLDKQPKIVQDAFNQIRQEYLNLSPLESNDELIKYFENKLQNGIDDFFEREATKNALRVLNGEKLSANGWQDLNNLNYQDLHKLDAYFTNGEDILKRLQNHFWDKPNKEELAQKILYDKGIKGISYNGGIDGEARVIFNPDDIVIGRKYYNQPNLYQQLTGKQNTGALVDALLNR